MNNPTEDNTSIRYFNININLFYLIFGNIANILKVAFFLQKPLRSLPCTVYILFSTFSDFITLNNLPVLQLLSNLYSKYHWIKVTVNWSNHHNQTVLFPYYSASTYDIIMCKTRSYFHMFSTDLSYQMLLFASINRFCSTYYGKNRQTNTYNFIKYFCNYSYVYKLCFILSLITALLSLQHIFNFTIDSPLEGCIPSNRILWVVWISLFHCFLFPILIILFGILTLRRIRYLAVLGDYFRRSQYHRQRKHRFLDVCRACSHCQNSIQYRIDRQLTSMIITEILVTILTLLPYGIYNFLSLLQTIQKKTMINPNESVWIPLLIQTTIYFEPSCGFYIYLMTLTTLRKRFFKIFIEKLAQNCFYY